MRKQAVDLLRDPPWSVGTPDGHPPAPAPRPALITSLMFLALFMGSMALPWFTSSATPTWTPFSHRLGLGWSPGTQDWGFLLLVVAAAVAVEIGIAIWKQRSVWMGVTLLSVSALVVATFFESSARRSGVPGPSLHSDYGAWIGDTVAAAAWISIAVATLRVIAARSRVRPR